MHGVRWLDYRVTIGDAITAPDVVAFGLAFGIVV